MPLLDIARQHADALACTIAQLALAWTLAQDKQAVPIPGTTNRQHLEDNFKAAEVTIPEDMLAELNRAFAPEAIAGPRYSPAAQSTVTTERYDFE